MDLNRIGELHPRNEVKVVTTECEWCHKEFSYLHFGKDRGQRRKFCGQSCRMKNAKRKKEERDDKG